MAQETKALIADDLEGAEGEAPATLLAEAPKTSSTFLKVAGLLAVVAVVAGTAVVSARADPRAANAAKFSEAKVASKGGPYEESLDKGFSPVTEAMETWSYSYSYSGEEGPTDPLSIKQHKEHQMKKQHKEHMQKQTKKEHQEAQQKKQKMGKQTKKEHQEHQEVQEKKQHQEKEEKQETKEKKEKADEDPN